MRKLHANDYIYYRYEDYDNNLDDEQYQYFVGFITKRHKNGVSVYSELGIGQDEWDLDEVVIPPRDIIMKLELKTLLDQIQEKYSTILI